MITTTTIPTPTFTSCVEIIGKWEELVQGEIFLLVNLTNGLPYNMATSKEITPFGVTYEGKDYYVNASELVNYQTAWLKDMSVRPIRSMDIQWDEF
jgi:hypothetical protein